MAEILCAAAADEHGPVPGIAPCAEFGEHRIICPDHEMYDDRPGTCKGCAPQAAQRGFLCAHHYEWAEQARVDWDSWRRLVLSADGRTVSPTGGGGSPLGFANLTLIQLSLDECERHLVSGRGTTFDLWVSTYEGAADALQFAQAAYRAYRSLEVEYRPPRTERFPCPHCGREAHAGFDTAESRGWVTVLCDWCRQEITRVRRPADSWVGSRECNSGIHVDCDRANCGCSCHEIGIASRVRGVSALWDADLATLGHVRREGWAAYPGGLIYERLEAAA